jgi:hypothetical protein
MELVSLLNQDLMTLSQAASLGVVVVLPVLGISPNNLGMGPDSAIMQQNTH